MSDNYRKMRDAVIVAVLAVFLCVTGKQYAASMETGIWALPGSSVAVSGREQETTAGNLRLETELLAGGTEAVGQQIQDSATELADTGTEAVDTVSPGAGTKAADAVSPGSGTKDADTGNPGAGTKAEPLTDLAEEFAVIRGGVTKDVIGGYPVDDAFLLWLDAQYGDAVIRQLAEYVASGGMEASGWRELTGSTMHALWVEYCRDTGYQRELLADVYWVEDTGASEDGSIVLGFAGDTDGETCRGIAEAFRRTAARADDSGKGPGSAGESGAEEPGAAGESGDGASGKEPGAAGESGTEEPGKEPGAAGMGETEPSGMEVPGISAELLAQMQETDVVFINCEAAVSNEDGADGAVPGGTGSWMYVGAGSASALIPVADTGRESVAGQEPGNSREPVAGQESGNSREPVAGQEPGNSREPVAGQESEAGGEPGSGWESESGGEPGPGQESPAAPDEMALQDTWYYVIKGRKIAVVSVSLLGDTARRSAGKAPEGALMAAAGGETEGEDELARALRRIGQAGGNSDLVIVLVRWGTEGNLYPDAAQTAAARAFVEAGADAVVGGHAHRLQGVGYLSGVPVAYSLGSLRFSEGLLYTAFLRIEIGEDNALRMVCVPCIQEADATRMLDAQEERAACYRYLMAISSGVGMDAEGAVLNLRAGSAQDRGAAVYDAAASTTEICGMGDINGIPIDPAGNYK